MKRFFLILLLPLQLLAGTASVSVDTSTAVVTYPLTIWTANAANISTALSSVYQPLDADLTAISALATTAYGRGYLTLADAAAGRSLLGLGTMATQDAEGLVTVGDILTNGPGNRRFESNSTTGTISWATAGGGIDLTITSEDNITLTPSGGAVTVDGNIKANNLKDEKVVYVSKGSNASNTRTGLSKYDPTRPFATISAAISGAASGDVVHVLPGTYDENLTLVTGVNLHFETGAIVDPSTGHAITAGAVTCKITGNGSFVGGGLGIVCQGATLYLEAASITGVDGGLWCDTTASTVTAKVAGQLSSVYIAVGGTYDLSSAYCGQIYTNTGTASAEVLHNGRIIAGGIGIFALGGKVHQYGDIEAVSDGIHATGLGTEVTAFGDITTTVDAPAFPDNFAKVTVYGNLKTIPVNSAFWQLKGNQAGAICETGELIVYGNVEAVQPVINCAGKVTIHGNIHATKAGFTYTTNPYLVDPLYTAAHPRITGAGTGATATATVVGGVITAVTLTSGGTGYSVAPTVSFYGSGATFTTTVAGGKVTGVTVTAGGVGYVGTVETTVSGGSGQGAVIEATAYNGVIIAARVKESGYGYSSSPSVAVVQNGTGASVTATVSGGAVTGFTSLVGGSGHTSPWEPSDLTQWQAIAVSNLSSRAETYIAGKVTSDDNALVRGVTGSRLYSIEADRAKKDARSFAIANGVTNLDAIQKLTDWETNLLYLNAWNESVAWPCKEVFQGVNTTTLASFGGLGTFNGTLTGTISIEADGVERTDAGAGYVLLGNLNPAFYNGWSVMAAGEITQITDSTCFSWISLSPTANTATQLGTISLATFCNGSTNASFIQSYSMTGGDLKRDRTYSGGGTHVVGSNVRLIGVQGESTTYYSQLYKDATLIGADGGSGGLPRANGATNVGYLFSGQDITADDWEGVFEFACFIGRPLSGEEARLLDMIYQNSLGL